jgi:two-component system OmpR family sensor kinase
MGDGTSLRQLIDNLLGNVRAHTPPGTTARVSVTRDASGAVIAVADTGPGMEPEEAEHVFERFYRSDPSRSRAHGGAGLGLSIVSAIVTAHGGTVSARGRVGSGTTFTVHLPATPPGADPVDVAASAEVADQVDVTDDRDADREPGTHPATTLFAGDRSIE